MISALALLGLLSGGGVLPVQQDMPIIPPPSQRRPGPPVQGPGGVPGGASSMEDLVRQGYEVKAMERYGQGDGRYVVLLQRSAEMRTCLLAVASGQGAPTRRSACY